MDIGKRLKEGLSNIGKRLKDTGRNIGKQFDEKLHQIAKSFTSVDSEWNPGMEVVPGLNVGQCAKISSSVYKTERPEYIDDYHYLPEFSSVEDVVYTHGNIVVIAFRGMKQVGDVVPAYDIMFGRKVSERWTAAEALYLKVRKAFPDKTVILTGHSLGGALAVHVSKRYGVKAEVFNSGTGFTWSRAPKVRSHLIQGDPLSVLARVQGFGATHVYKGNDLGALDAHQLRNFIK